MDKQEERTHNTDMDILEELDALAENTEIETENEETLAAGEQPPEFLSIIKGIAGLTESTDSSSAESGKRFANLLSDTLSNLPVITDTTQAEMEASESEAAATSDASENAARTASATASATTTESRSRTQTGRYSDPYKSDPFLNDTPRKGAAERLAARRKASGYGAPRTPKLLIALVGLGLCCAVAAVIWFIL